MRSYNDVLNDYWLYLTFDNDVWSKIYIKVEGCAHRIGLSYYWLLLVLVSSQERYVFLHTYDICNSYLMYVYLDLIGFWDGWSIWWWLALVFTECRYSLSYIIENCLPYLFYMTFYFDECCNFALLDGFSEIVFGRMFVLLDL